MNSDKQKEALRFMRLIWSLDHELRSRSKLMEKRIGVTGPQRLALLVLGEVTSMTAGELAHELHLHPSTLTGILDRLRRKGFISCTRDPQDSRRTVLALLPEGRKILTDREFTVEEAVKHTLASSTAAEVRSASRLLAALSRELTRKSKR